jgi:hypothetical protein
MRHCLNAKGVAIARDRQLQVKLALDIEAMEIVLTQSVKNVALIPPNMVYKTTPSGRRKQAAGVGMPVKAVTTADPPVNSIAVTRMLVIKPKMMNVICVGVPYLALMTSRKVYIV